MSKKGSKRTDLDQMIDLFDKSDIHYDTVDSEGDSIYLVLSDVIAAFEFTKDGELLGATTEPDDGALDRTFGFGESEIID